jgi:hypothetical protein
MGKHTAPEEPAAETSAESARPTLRIVKGNPTPEEIAALTVVLAAASQGAATEESATAVGGWSDPGRTTRSHLRPGPGAWRASAWT